MTVLALGTCMLIAAAAQSGWESPRLLQPLASLGERSYEIYLTHMFVVFALFDWFLAAGRPMIAIPWLFAGTVICSAILGAITARLYSKPLNSLIRRKSVKQELRVEAGVSSRESVPLHPLKHSLRVVA